MPFYSNFNLPNTAAFAVGIPTAFAGLLRIRYGPTIWKDLATLKAGVAIKKEVKKLIADGFTLVDIFQSQVQRNPDKPFILFEDDSYSYAEIDREANQMARFVQHSGVAGLRDTVAMLMYNEPAFISIFFALNKLGVTAAFLNYNLRAQSLLHCIEVSEAKAVICGKEPELLEALMDIMPELKALGITIWVHGRQEEALPAVVSHFETEDFSSEPIPREIRKDQRMDDICCYIFTSGTTGVPKPCNIHHWRAVKVTYIQHSLNLGPDDIVYIPLPLYHSAAMCVGIMNLLRVGATGAISRRFSAKKFWDEVRKFRATEIQYIGETCRYLLAQPPRPNDGKYDHKVRIAIGNGLRPDIWEEFQRRFNIGTIAEFFGATEANGLTLNTDGKVGACGRYTPFFKAMFDTMDFIRCDPDTSEAIRDKNGMCILVPPGETGLLVFKVTDDAPLTGYKAPKEINEKKILRNVKKKGDVYFNTGDLLSYDKDGYMYFVDRLGDTFRWKGENVATTEVAEILNKFPGVQEANVYGVKMPGNMDGRAGMAAIVLLKDVPLPDMKKLYQYVTKNLPMYACPKFLRIMPEMHITGTFKHKKTDFVKQGFDPNLVTDPLYFLEAEKKTYVPLDTETLQKIVAGRAKL